MTDNEKMTCDDIVRANGYISAAALMRRLKCSQGHAEKVVNDYHTFTISEKWQDVLNEMIIFARNQQPPINNYKT